MGESRSVYTCRMSSSHFCLGLDQRHASQSLLSPLPQHRETLSGPALVHRRSSYPEPALDYERVAF